MKLLAIFVLLGMVSCGSMDEQEKINEREAEATEAEVLAEIEAEASQQSIENLDLSPGRKAAHIWHRVNRAYGDFLGRQADSGGRGYWLRAAHNMSCQQFAVAFAKGSNRESFWRSNHDFTRRLYRGFVGSRLPSAGTINYFARYASRHGKNRMIDEFFRVYGYRMSRSQCW